MPQEKITRRQKDLARMLRKRRKIYGSKLKTFKKNTRYRIPDTKQ